MENKNVVLDIIIEFVKALKNKDEAIETIDEGKLYKIWHCKYLLDQILRQWEVPEERWYISKKAQKLWDELAKPEPITSYHYNKSVVCTCENPVEVRIYKGNGNDFETTTLQKGNRFKFNAVFHEDHVVPNSLIIKELLKLEELNYENVEKILNKITMCRILKEEDKKLNEVHAKIDRPCDSNRVFSEIYMKKAGIDVEIK